MKIEKKIIYICPITKREFDTEEKARESAKANVRSVIQHGAVFASKCNILKKYRVPIVLIQTDFRKDNYILLGKDVSIDNYGDRPRTAEEFFYSHVNNGTWEYIGNIRDGFSKALGEMLQNANEESKSIVS